ncbi:DNA cytosine methyltransferase [Thalassospira xiamenensis]|uniref:DNA (cytosine-5-)-methyltransferase n=1 Tax=Thalassospira xiamenensis TaxID=220697 RepID=A0A285TY52_9PROT|nr:DNA cytosine methyltransferase [Thalassospira xiamenensis]SOC30525.1 DNA (cytosine-5)-methyltransferase 1 [Thalassospira xiamenensis]
MLDLSSIPQTPRRLRVASCFSGMEAASVAAKGMNWDFRAFAEIEPAACETLDQIYGCGRPIYLPNPDHATSMSERKADIARIKRLSTMRDRSPGSPANLGDISQVDWTKYRGRLDLMVGGPPCQAFSIAGPRLSLADKRGQLSLSYVEAIHDSRVPWSFTENVPGWLSTKDNAFGCFLGALVGADRPLPAPGKRWGSAGFVDGPLYRAAWRVIDAQGFVPQRRRRVLVVAARVDCGGDPIRVLFETEAEARVHLGDRAHSGPLFPVSVSGSGHLAPRAETQEEIAKNPAESSLRGREKESGPEAYRVHAYGSAAMTNPNGKAPMAERADTARCLDTVGGFSCGQGGNLVLQHEEAQAFRTAGDGAVYAEGDKSAPLTTQTDPCANIILQYQDVSEVSSTVTSNLAKASFDSDCSGTLLVSDDIVNISCDSETEIEALAFSAKDYGGDVSNIAPTLRAGAFKESHANSGSHIGVVIPQTASNDNPGHPGDLEAYATETGVGFWSERIPSLRVSTAPSQPQTIVKQIGMMVRRLMPLECLRLQGFPDDYFDKVLIRGKPIADGPMYKMIGNSWAVPVARWVFRRLDAAILQPSHGEVQTLANENSYYPFIGEENNA